MECNDYKVLIFKLVWKLTVQFSFSFLLIGNYKNFMELELMASFSTLFLQGEEISFELNFISGHTTF